MKNKGISKRLRMKILVRDNFMCQKCEEIDKTGRNLEVHHKKLRVLGGTDNESNLITLCFICHKYAPNKEEEFKEYIQDRCDGLMTTTLKIFKIFRNKYSDKEWENLNSRIESERSL